MSCLINYVSKHEGTGVQIASLARAPWYSKQPLEAPCVFGPDPGKPSKIEQRGVGCLCCRPFCSHAPGSAAIHGAGGSSSPVAIHTCRLAHTGAVPLVSMHTVYALCIVSELQWYCSVKSHILSKDQASFLMRHLKTPEEPKSRSHQRLESVPALLLRL